MPTLRLDPGEAVKLYGPMSVTLKSGRVDVHGKVVNLGERFIIHKTRNYVLLALEPSEIEVSMLDESQIQGLDPSDPYLEKRRLVEEALSKGYRRFIVLGPVDCGKTSLTTMIFNIAMAQGLSPAVVDGDVGQADIGPPGFITLGSSDKQVYWLNELQPISMRFIGDIKPQHYAQLIVCEIARLVESAHGAGYKVVAVDTDGWVRDEQGLLHKAMLIEKLRPDAIFVLGEELKGVFKWATKLGIAVYEHSAPIYRRVRSREERRLLRSLRYRAYLEGAGVVKLKLSEVVVEGCPLFMASEVDKSALTQFIDGKVLYASGVPGVLYVYGAVKAYNLEELKKLGYEKVKVYPIGFERGLYCALTSPAGGENPGVIEKFDPETRELVVRSRCTGRVERLKLARFKLSESFTEEFLEGEHS